MITQSFTMVELTLQEILRSLPFTETQQSSDTDVVRSFTLSLLTLVFDPTFDIV